ncbi:MAG: LacI family transcriptional regulator [Bacilli bacterium]|jgi:LacI family transcriptional regulator|nr:LacI family transcriptional regulator [Bacilli bacterium]
MDNLKDRVTIYQVAQAAGVSLATVSRVINKQGNVTDTTRAKVEETIKRLGYKPSGLAQALATNKTTNIGVIIPSANYVYISNMLNGISVVAKEKGFVLTLFTTSHSRDEALSMIEKVITTHVDGAIIFDDELDDEDVMKISSYSVPTIVINNRVVADRVGCVLFAYGELLKEIIKDYYAKGGDKEMTFLHVHDGGRLLGRCEKTFVDTHEKIGKAYHIVNCDDSYTRTYGDFCDYFKIHRGGYFVAYRDSIAAACENAATDAGLKVPEDVEVLSLVGTKYANIIRPTLTAMHIDMQEVGKRAMYMLIDLIHNDLIEKSYRFDAKLIERNSTINR